MNCLLKIEILIFLFIIFVVGFSLLYKYTDNTIDYSDALYLSVSYQTFTGASSVEINKKLRNVSTIQMLVSYIIIVIIVYNILQN
jgi:hypothetical protein